jgi:hypothetical protein
MTSIDNIFKIHGGLQEVMVPNLDPISHDDLWPELFKSVGIELGITH